MSSRRFIIFFLGIFCLGALPIVIVQPSGAASAGLNAGFVLPLEHPLYVFLCAVIGLLASIMGRDAPVYVPSSMLAMLVAGHMLGLDASQFSASPYIILGCVLLVILVAGVIARRAELLGVLLASSLGFHLGYHTVFLVPEVASPLYFLVGILLSVMLILATSISLGLTLFSDDWRLGRSLRESPKLNGFRSLFN